MVIVGYFVKNKANYVLSKGIVGLAGVKLLGMFCVCLAYRQRLPTLAAFYQSGKQADFIGLPRTCLLYTSATISRTTRMPPTPLFFSGSSAAGSVRCV